MKIMLNVLLLLILFFFPSISYAETPDIKDNYIVVLKEKHTPNQIANIATEIAKTSNGRVGYLYQHTIHGFSISVPQAALQGISKNPNVDYIEPDIVVLAFDLSTEQEVPTGIRRINADSIFTIDQIDDLRVDADVAVLDTGIDFEHPDLNVVGGANCMNSTKGSPMTRTYFCDPNGNADDDHYHGTHVAGTIAALDNSFGVVGVAPGARLWAVKVLSSSGSGSLSGIIAGIDWVVAQGDIEVINMSLGGSGQSNAMDEAIKSAYDNGVFIAVAAGNSGADSANYTPANAPYAFTVSALADDDGLEGSNEAEWDSLAYFSNWGDEVNIIAPGVSILSTYPIEKGSYASISGTSMATPHVAGAAALLASQRDDPSTIWDSLINNGSDNWVDDSGDGVQEPLLDVAATGVTPKTIDTLQTNTAPTAIFTYNCSELSCNFDASDSSSNDENDAITFSWDFGESGDTGGAGVTPEHTYGVDGTYTVILTVTDSGNLTATSSQQISVSSIPTPSAEIVTTTSNDGKTWSATVSYRDSSTISGTWSDGTPCSAEQCAKNDILKKQSSVSFTTSNQETVTIFKP